MCGFAARLYPGCHVTDSAWGYYVTWKRITIRFITARRYASAVYAVVVCPSVRLSVTSRHCIETTRRIELVFGTGASFNLFILYTVLRKFNISRITVHSCETLPQTLDIENFATASRWCGQQFSLTVAPVHYTYDGRARRGWTHEAYYQLVDCNPLGTNSITSICSGFIVQLVHTVVQRNFGNILTNTSRRAVRLR